MLRKILVLGLLLFLISGLSFTQTRNDSATAGIKATDAAWEKAFAARDIEAALKFYAEDAVAMEPEMPAMSGKTAIRKFLEDSFKDKNFVLHWTATAAEVAKSGDLGYTRGTFEFTYTDAAGKVAKSGGKYLTVWKKVGSEWKAAVDINNGNGPSK